MRCQEAKFLLSPYLDNSITDKEKARLESHLVGCSSCAKELEELRWMVEALRCLEDKEAPEDFMVKVRAKLESEKNITLVRKGFIGSRASWVVASAAGVALAFGIYLSSLLPAEKVAGWLDKVPALTVGKDGTVNVSIEKLIREKQKELRMAKENQESPGAGSNQDNNRGEIQGHKSNLTEPKVENTKVMVAEKQAQISPLVMSYVNVSVKADDADKAVQQVLKIAEVNDAKVESFVPQVMSGKAFGYTIWVPEDKVSAVLGDLRQAGCVVGQGEDEKEVTDECQKIISRLAEIDQETKELKAQQVLEKDAKTKLEVLDFEKNYLQGRLKDMESKRGLVGINVVVSEGGNL